MLGLEKGHRHAAGKFLQCISIYNDPKLRDAVSQPIYPYVFL